MLQNSLKTTNNNKLLCLWKLQVIGEIQLKPELGGKKRKNRTGVGEERKQREKQQLNREKTTVDVFHLIKKLNTSYLWFFNINVYDGQNKFEVHISICSIFGTK